MQNGFARWFASLLLCFFSSTFCFSQEDWLWEGDTSLVLPMDKPERLVSMSGELALQVLYKNPENPELETVDRFIIKMDSESFEVACSIPVRAAFHSPDLGIFSIFLNYNLLFFDLTSALLLLEFASTFSIDFWFISFSS